MAIKLGAFNGNQQTGFGVSFVLNDQNKVWTVTELRNGGTTVVSYKPDGQFKDNSRHYYVNQVRKGHQFILEYG